MLEIMAPSFWDVLTSLKTRIHKFTYVLRIHIVVLMYVHTIHKGDHDMSPEKIAIIIPTQDGIIITIPC